MVKEKDWVPDVRQVKFIKDFKLIWKIIGLLKLYSTAPSLLGFSNKVKRRSEARKEGEAEEAILAQPRFSESLIITGHFENAELRYNVELCVSNNEQRELKIVS